MYEQCPNDCYDITLFEVNLDTENNEVIYRCWGCDWIETESDPFFISTWIISINQALAPIDIFQSLATNKDIVEFLRPRLKGESYLSLPGSAWEFTVGSDEYLRGEIDIAYQTYLRQMIVLGATYIELILKEFFHSFAVANPLLLIELLTKDKSFQHKAMDTVTFDKIMNEKAKEEVFKRAFDLIREKDRWRVVKYLANRTPIKLDCDLLYRELHLLIDQRNNIIHHNLYDPINDAEIDVQQVYDNFKLIIKLLYTLEEIAKKNSVPYWKEFEYKFDEFI